MGVATKDADVPLSGEADGVLRRSLGMLKQHTGVIGDAKTNIRNIEARTANSQASVEVVLDISDLKHLEQIIAGLRKIPGVHEVQRLAKNLETRLGRYSREAKDLRIALPRM